jgi:SNF2 family DNA or RNA helicase
LYEEEKSESQPTSTASAQHGAGGEESAFDPMDLYRELSRCSDEGKRKLEREETLIDGSLLADEIPDLVATLRAYQRKAVSWMKLRETQLSSRVSGSDAADDETTVRDSNADKGKENLEAERSASSGVRPLHPLWTEYHGANAVSEDDAPFYFNQFTGKLSLKRFTAPSDVSGGILADEMGTE